MSEEIYDAGRWHVDIATDDESIVRRRRAIAPVQALAEIDRTKAMLDGDHWPQYDLVTICLAVIDQVALAMGISAGRTWDEVLDYATGQAARQRPDATGEEHRSVAERVLVSLVTTDVTEAAYLAHDEHGPQWRASRFRLLYLHTTGPDALEHLRASEQAINLFVDALDLDIEAAQIANEAQLAALIARGALDAAVHIANAARFRSVQYQEQVRRIIADTLIDPDSHDWIDGVPAVLSGALDHVTDRLAAEAALLDAVAERRVDAADSGAIREANELIALLRECRHRHDELHQHLIGARSRLRAALEERLSRPARTARRFDIGRELLEPFFALPTGTAQHITPRLVAVAGSVAARWWPTLAVLVDELCAPAREPAAGEDYEPPEFDDTETAAWWEAIEDIAESLVAGIDEPVRLSQLLARAGDVIVSDVDGEPVDPRLFEAAVTHTAHRAWAARLAGRSAGERVVVAVATGSRVEGGTVRAEDLLLVPAEITADIAAPEPGRLLRDQHLLDDLADDFTAAGADR